MNADKMAELKMKKRELLEECIENHRPITDYDTQYYDLDVLY